VANKRHNAGFYVNVISEVAPEGLEQIKHKFAMNSDVFRVIFTSAPAPKAVAA
jgi:ribosomal protein S6